ncbi:MAG: 6-hydroxymethylpterin diphosphokinase MptE-like protein [Pseudomonadota bacterium]
MQNIRLERLIHNRHRGETVVLVANGPSLNRTDFDLVRNRTTFGLNKIFLGFRQFRFYPNYYVAVNEKVLRQSVDQVRQLNCVKFLSNRAPDLFSNNALTYIIDTTSPKHRFAETPLEGLDEGWTVTYVALQLAFYMGFSRVVIVGLDHRFEYEGAPNESRLLQGADPNHFSPDYFAHQEWDNPDLANSEASFRFAREHFEAAGRQIIDATEGGACEVFEKRPLSRCFD